MPKIDLAAVPAARVRAIRHRSMRRVLHVRGGAWATRAVFAISASI